MKKKLIFSVIVLVGVAVLTYNYVYKDHRDIETEQPSFKLASGDFIEQFNSNPTEAETKFLNKTIEISGVVSEVNGERNIVLNNTIFCQFQEPFTNTISVNTSQIIKGRCIGYDDLLEEIKLDQCHLIDQ